MKVKATHIFDREENEHYVEERWCSERLFQEEEFVGLIDDPFCGFGTIPKSAHAAGFEVTATDLVNRGYSTDPFKSTDFFDDDASDWTRDNLVANPPFDCFKAVAFRALELTARKVALVWQTPRLNAAGAWLEATPLRRVWFMTPRPSMPPGHVVREYEAKGKRPSGGTQDYVWLVWERGYVGQTEMKWLRRQP